MPKITNYKYRMWCKSCNDFTLHERIFADETKHPDYSLCGFDGLEDKPTFICNCKTKYSSVKVSEIPVDKIEAQRERFKAQRNKRLSKLISSITSSSALDDGFFDLPTVKSEIVESDAGLEKKEAYEKAQRDKERREFAFELERFQGLGRNEVCLCGSGLKYKKCCYSKHKK